MTNRSQDCAICFKISHQCGLQWVVFFRPDNVHNCKKVKFWTFKRWKIRQKTGKNKKHCAESCLATQSQTISDCVVVPPTLFYFLTVRNEWNRAARQLLLCKSPISTATSPVIIKLQWVQTYNLCYGIYGIYGIYVDAKSDHVTTSIPPDASYYS